MNSSETLNELAPALVAVQRSLRNPKPDTKGQVRGRANYAYLSLPGLIESVREAFKDVGLAWVQEVVSANGGIGVTTRIVHLSGQWLEVGPLVLPATGGPQDFGSAITYARRYSLAAAVGLAADEDDDAQRVQPSGQAKTSAAPETDAAGGPSLPPAGQPPPAASSIHTCPHCGEKAVTARPGALYGGCGKCQKRVKML